jgi:hypothetical protein
LKYHDEAKNIVIIRISQNFKGHYKKNNLQDDVNDCLVVFLKKKMNGPVLASFSMGLLCQLPVDAKTSDNCITTRATPILELMETV